VTHDEVAAGTQKLNWWLLFLVLGIYTNTAEVRCEAGSDILSTLPRLVVGVLHKAGYAQNVSPAWLALGASITSTSTFRYAM
jgi:hypothetical protein